MQLSVMIFSENPEHKAELLNTKPRWCVLFVLDVFVWTACDLRKVKLCPCD
jgi:hypothetical protein